MRGRAAPTRLRHRVLENVRRHRLWEPGDAVVVACSGGLDSLVLLDVLCDTVGAHRAVLSVVTVDHQVRPSSGADTAFVQEEAAARGVPCEVVPVAPTGTDEQALRQARQEVFQRIVDRGARLATGHHRRDQAETVLLQLLRSTGTAGRRGMVWSGAGRVRPLLNVSMGQLAQWAEARGLRWREDPTNQDPRYLRNRVRHELLPRLDDLRPGAEAALARSATHAAEDEAYLRRKVDEAIGRHGGPGGGLSVRWVAAGPAALVRRAVRARWPSLGAGGVDAVVAMARRGQGAVSLDVDDQLVVDGAWVTRARR